MQDDTIKLLRECNAGIKMGVRSLDEVMDHVKDCRLREILLQSKNTHEMLGNETHGYLNQYHDQGKEPTPVAKMMSWMKTNVMLTGEDSDRIVADVLTDGCNMGTKSLYKYLHQYPAAQNEVKELTKDVIQAEEKLIKELREYL